MNWEKLGSPDRGTFKNPNFWDLFESTKTLKYILIPRFQSPNFEYIDKLKKVVS